jgi:hypothetical protein
MTHTPPSTARAAWRLSDEDQWWPLEHGGATIRIAMPAGPLHCYGCGRTESDDVQFGAMIPMRHADSGADWTLFLCDDCWADAAIESNLQSLWDTILEPQL